MAHVNSRNNAAQALRKHMLTSHLRLVSHRTAVATSYYFGGSFDYYTVYGDKLAVSLRCNLNPSIVNLVLLHRDRV